MMDVPEIHMQHMQLLLNNYDLTDCDWRIVKHIIQAAYDDGYKEAYNGVQEREAVQ